MGRPSWKPSRSRESSGSKGVRAAKKSVEERRDLMVRSCGAISVHLAEAVAAVGGGGRAALVVGALGIVYVVWGSTYLAIRVTARDLPAMASACWRYFAAAVVLASILALRGGWRRLRAGRRELLGCAALGLLLPTMGNGVVVVGEQMGAPSGLTALLIAAVPLWVVVYRSAAGDRRSP